ncbi:MAG: ATP synthase F0 subunit B [Bdellovibrionales bacterium]|nr:ATP synthase F0 subunit B [Bdellovibrionales bacterium]
MKVMIIVLSMLATVAWAAGGGHGDPHAIPLKAIAIQAFNFGVLLLLLAYFLKKPIQSLFADRGEQYEAHLKVAQAAKEEAEKKKTAIKERLQTLTETADQSVQKAKADAEELKHQIIADAKNLARKLEEEAHRTVDYEAQKAVAMIRQELIDKSLSESEKHLKTEINKDDQKRLQNEFVSKIQVVQI